MHAEISTLPNRSCVSKSLFLFFLQNPLGLFIYLYRSSLKISGIEFEGVLFFQRLQDSHSLEKEVRARFRKKDKCLLSIIKRRGSFSMDTPRML